MKAKQYLIFLYIVSLSYAYAFSDQKINRQYDAIMTLLKKYKRSFTFMEVGTKNGELTFEIARRFENATCIMSEMDNIRLVLESCKNKPELKNIILLKHEFCAEDFKRFGECEHIDVVFISDIAIHENWKEVLDAALTLGDYIIIELYRKSALFRQIQQYALQNSGKLFADSHYDDDSLYIFDIHKKHIFRRSWNYGKKLSHGEYTIQSSFIEKKFIKEKKQPKGYSVTDWNPGMNLNTFKILNGVYPLKSEIRALLKPLSSIQHNDLHIFNIILQGKKLIPIDCNENGRHHNVQDMLPKIIDQFRFNKLTLLQEFEVNNNYLKIIENAIHEC